MGGPRSAAWSPVSGFAVSAEFSAGGRISVGVVRNRPSSNGRVLPKKPELRIWLDIGQRNRPVHCRMRGCCGWADQKRLAARPGPHLLRRQKVAEHNRSAWRARRSHVEVPSFQGPPKNQIPNSSCPKSKMHGIYIDMNHALTAPAGIQNGRLSSLVRLIRTYFTTDHFPLGTPKRTWEREASLRIQRNSPYGRLNSDLPN